MSNQPHIILITADELRKDVLGAYGCTAIETPALDALAQEGTRFESAYTASPWCLPSRCALVTGLYPHNNRAYSNFRDLQLDPTLPNLYNQLSAGGYHTAHIGKCHYAPVPYKSTRPDQTLPYEDFRAYYQSLGMDDLILQDDKQVSVWFYDDYSKELDEAGYLSAYRDAIWDRTSAKVFPFPAPAEWHPDSWVGRKAAEYIEQYTGDTPLFTWVSFSGPHFPFDAPAAYFERVDMSKAPPRVLDPHEFEDASRIHADTFNGGKRSTIEAKGLSPQNATSSFDDDYWYNLQRNYYANVALIDDYVGQIIAAAKAALGDNVLIMFTADHGEMLGNHGLWGKNNCSYEDVLNVPLIVRSPHSMPPLPSITDAKVSLVDLLPTCMQAARVTDYHSDGAPLSQQVTDGGRPFVLSEGEGFVSIRDERFKYTRVRQGNSDFTELIDLQDDPHEFKNAIRDADKQAALAQLQQYLIDTYMDNLIP